MDIARHPGLAKAAKAELDSESRSGSMPLDPYAFTREADVRLSPCNRNISRSSLQLHEGIGFYGVDYGVIGGGSFKTKRDGRGLLRRVLLQRT